MSLTDKTFARGSEWRQWDLHIHSPASFHWSGEKFEKDLFSPKNMLLVDELIQAINASEPAVFALMDYWTFDGWFALQHRLSQSGAPTLEKTVFPGIELRLSAPIPRRLNAHVIFSNETTNQTLRDFMSNLHLELIDRSLSNEALIEYARSVGDDKLKKHGFAKADLSECNDSALKAGQQIAELNCDSYKQAILSVQNGQAIGFMPFDTNDGLGSVDWEEHYAYTLGLFNTSPIFETRNHDLWGAFVGEETPGNKDWISNFQAALKNVPRLAISGSDAHRFEGAGEDNDKRGYGDFPSEKVTWIKADPTFLGLLQAIKEPAKRSYIGRRPPKLSEIEGNKTYFIDTVNVRKSDDAKAKETWLDGCSVELNPDLVSIIGNKGSGKSALADVIAVLGNSQQHRHFSFLKKDRFRGKSGEPAKSFDGTLSWCDESSSDRNLNENPTPDSVELVKYIPQGYFEELCNDHVSGKSDAFEKELRKVIFSHADDSIRLGASDFDQLLELQEGSLREQLGDFRNELSVLNQKIVDAERQLQPHMMASLLERLEVKKRQISEHEKIKPEPLPEPGEELSDEQQAISTKLEKITNETTTLDDSIVEAKGEQSKLAQKAKSVRNIRERIGLLERYINQFELETAGDLDVVGLTREDLVTVNISLNSLDKIERETKDKTDALNKHLYEIEKKKAELLAESQEMKDKLAAPQLKYQQRKSEIETWEKKLQELTGNERQAETLQGLAARIEQLEKLPEEHAELCKKRLDLTGEIFDTLDSQRKEREALFAPVQKLIRENSLIRDDYKLQFQATLVTTAESISDLLFYRIKQNMGEFRGEEESYSLVQKICDKYDLGQRQQLLDFLTELSKKITDSANSSKKGTYGILPILRKGVVPEDVYDEIFGLSFLSPRYTLLFQETPIEQLSPGQRGALLLIFYLLVDKDHNPIVLDQPEENLDNETVVSLLVPVVNEAKKKRQIIMVTHNPNLAVVCDAEQVIYSSFNRKDEFTISYSAGAIENPSTNKHVVNVLEGTKPAFDNRRSKYH